MTEEISFKIGDFVEAEIIKINPYGAFVKLPNNKRGLIHISQVAEDFVEDINTRLKVGEKVTARVKKISSDGKIDLTLKKGKNAQPALKQEKEFRSSTFEEKLEEFLKRTSEKIENVSA